MVVEHLVETECVYSPSVEITTITNVMVNTMKYEVVMNSVVKVRKNMKIYIITA